MSAPLKPLAVEGFLAWERTQPVRHRSDGTQPVATSGGTTAADRMARRLLPDLGRRLRPSREVSGKHVKVPPGGRVRCPNVGVARGAFGLGAGCGRLFPKATEGP